MAKHIYEKHTDCRTEGSCPVCEGGLSICTVCGLAEGSLTTDCPGEESYAKYGERVYAGELDYHEERGWVQAASLHSPVGIAQRAEAIRKGMGW